MHSSIDTFDFVFVTVEIDFCRSVLFNGMHKLSKNIIVILFYTKKISFVLCFNVTFDRCGIFWTKIIHESRIHIFIYDVFNIRFLKQNDLLLCCKF